MTEFLLFLIICLILWNFMIQVDVVHLRMKMEQNRRALNKTNVNVIELAKVIGTDIKMLRGSSKKKNKSLPS